MLTTVIWLKKVALATIFNYHDIYHIIIIDITVYIHIFCITHITSFNVTTILYIFNALSIYICAHPMF